MPQVRVLLASTPTMPASTLAQRVGWVGSASVFRVKVAQAAALRHAYQSRLAARFGATAKTGAELVGVRALSDYDNLFALTTSTPATVAGRLLEVV